MKTVLFFIIILFVNIGLAQDYLFFRYTNFYDTAYPLTRQAIVQYNKSDNSIVYVELKKTTKFGKEPSLEMADFDRILIDINKKDAYLFNKAGNIIFTSVYGFDSMINVTDTVVFDWKLIDETKQINNYRCYKASTNFRGRVWIASYCPEIAINYGPWKFWGLPGLIFEVSDADNIYNFYLSQIENQINDKIAFPIKQKQIPLKAFIENEQEQGVVDNLDRNVKVETKFVRKTPELIYEWEMSK